MAASQVGRAQTASNPARNLPRSYQPSRPTFSPYLNLLRRDIGQILPSYQAFVVPRIRELEFRDQQQSNVQQLERGLREVREVQSIATGVSGSFGNEARFFRTSPSRFRTHLQRP
jgi:hypothetical protein